MGVNPRELASTNFQYGAVPFCIPVVCIAGTATYNVPDVNGLVHITPCSVIRVDGVMTGAGGAGDTVQVFDADSNAITEAIDLSALTTDDAFVASTISISNGAIPKNQRMIVVTASGATCVLNIWCVRT